MRRSRVSPSVSEGPNPAPRSDTVASTLRRSLVLRASLSSLVPAAHPLRPAPPAPRQHGPIRLGPALLLAEYLLRPRGFQCRLLGVEGLAVCRDTCIFEDRQLPAPWSETTTPSLSLCCTRMVLLPSEVTFHPVSRGTQVPVGVHLAIFTELKKITRPSRSLRRHRVPAPYRPIM
jgi:hypothetical protein